MKNTKIQWCHSTINPVMGCDGCELWTSPSKIQSIILPLLPYSASHSKDTVAPLLARSFGDRTTSEVYSDREAIAVDLAQCLGLDRAMRVKVIDVIRHECKCYAGMLGTFRAGHKGYADMFESPKLFPGRLAEAAKWGLPSENEIADKPWLRALPRLIFVSDMGDALSKTVSFEYLKQEIVDNVNSPSGQRHIWLWLSKRPGRMAEFGRWLRHRGVDWPDNLVAMTTVTGQRFARRVNALRDIPSKFKGLSIEPLFGSVQLDLTGIDWVIVGGGSDVLADAFHIEWALDLQQQCQSHGIAFFLKQLGKKPFHKGVPIELNDRHGGDWDEWPAAWRVREFPSGFSTTLDSIQAGLADSSTSMGRPGSMNKM